MKCVLLFSILAVSAPASGAELTEFSWQVFHTVPKPGVFVRPSRRLPLFRAFSRPSAYKRADERLPQVLPVPRFRSRDRVAAHVRTR